MTNEQALYPHYKKLLYKIEMGDLIVDKSGVKIAEIIAPRIELDPTQEFFDFEGRKSPRKYIKKEDDWYNSHELKIDRVSDVAIWQSVSDNNNEINSNYGNLVYSRNNFSQFTNALETLKNHKETRQAIILYTRPSIHYEWNSHGASDFICTNFQHFLIRDNKLHCITSMRSNDIIFGATNDIYWFNSVIRDMYSNLIDTYSDLEYGSHIYIPNSLHAYERHFEKVRTVVEENKDLEI